MIPWPISLQERQENEHRGCLLTFPFSWVSSRCAREWKQVGTPTQLSAVVLVPLTPRIPDDSLAWDRSCCGSASPYTSEVAWKGPERCELSPFLPFHISVGVYIVKDHNFSFSAVLYFCCICAECSLLGLYHPPLSPLLFRIRNRSRHISSPIICLSPELKVFQSLKWKSHVIFPQTTSFS